MTQVLDKAYNRAVSNNFIMNLTITNRKLLREFKELKGRLINGDIEEILIPQDENSTIRISLIQKKTPFLELLDKIKKKPMKTLKRPEMDLF